MKSVKSVTKKLGIPSLFKLAQSPPNPPLNKGGAQRRKEKHKGFMGSNQADFISFLI